MANKAKTKSAKKRVNFIYLHKLKAGVALLALFVIVTAGIIAEASTLVIALRATLVILVIIAIAVIIERVLLSYEEMHSGKA